jgi:hypothetical protein
VEELRRVAHAHRHRHRQRKALGRQQRHPAQVVQPDLGNLW